MSHAFDDEQLTQRLMQHEAVRRVSLEVAGEQVTLWLRGGRLHESCTCGVERCEHAQGARRLLLDRGPATLERVRGSSRPPPAIPEQRLLHEAIEALALATARAGVVAQDSPSIRSALDQLLAAAPAPLPLALARWVGRFQDAREQGEVGEVARLLDGLLRLGDALRGGSAPELPALRRAWLGSLEPLGTTPVADVSLLEVAREWLDGVERVELERRYLVELASGAAYVEERRRSEPEISVGPCPRLAHVAYAEVDGAARPPRARLHQYTISSAVPESAWQRLLELALTELSTVRGLFSSEQSSSPGLAEPFVIFAPSELAPEEGAVLDREGERLAIGSERRSTGLEPLLAARGTGDLAAVLGRLSSGAAGLVLHPLSLLVRRGEWLELRRVT